MDFTTIMYTVTAGGKLLDKCPSQQQFIFTTAI